MSTVEKKQQEILFKEMLRIRRVEEEIAKRYSEQKMRCPVHLSIGQEAIAVGVCSHLTAYDYLVSNHRAHAHYLAKGGSLKEMIAEIYGKKEGCTGGRGGSMHLVDLSVGMMGSTPLVGGTIPIGVGLSFSSFLKKEERVTVIFFGEGSTEEGVFAESINFASLKNLPTLFICENNLYSVYSPLSVRQSEKRDRVAIAKAHGLFADQGDGNNVEEVFIKTEAALNHIKQGKGAAFLEFATYRFREHCGPFFDNNIGYRTPEEAMHWEEKCPIKTSQEKLLKEKTVSETLLKKWEQAIQEEIAEAFVFAENSPFSTFDLEEERVYAEREIR